MLPKIQQQAVPTNPAATGSTLQSKKDNIATTLVLEDHLKSMLSKTANLDYKPWKSKYAPKNPHSPFGNFPNEFMKITKITTPKIAPVHEESQAATTINKYSSKNQGTGGKTSLLLEKKPLFNAPKPIAGAYSKRKILVSEFRRFHFIYLTKKIVIFKYIS